MVCTVDSGHIRTCVWYSTVRSTYCTYKSKLTHILYLYVHTVPNMQYVGFLLQQVRQSNTSTAAAAVQYGPSRMNHGLNRTSATVVVSDHEWTATTTREPQKYARAALWNCIVLAAGFFPTAASILIGRVSTDRTEIHLMHCISAFATSLRMRMWKMNISMDVNSQSTLQTATRFFWRLTPRAPPANHNMI